MIVLDSCVWIALINEQDNQHQKAKEVFQKINLHELKIYDYIYVEILTVLQLRINKEACQKFILMIAEMSLEINMMEKEMFLKTNEIFLMQEKKLSFVDCFLVGLENCQVITFDQDLQKYLQN